MGPRRGDSVRAVDDRPTPVTPSALRGRGEHLRRVRVLAGPELERLRRLVHQHAQARHRLRAARLRGGEQRRFGRVVDEVEEQRARLDQRPRRNGDCPAPSRSGRADRRAVHDRDRLRSASRYEPSPQYAQVIVVPVWRQRLHRDGRCGRVLRGWRPIDEDHRSRPPRSAPARPRAPRRRCRASSCACPSRRSRRPRAASARSRATSVLWPMSLPSAWTIVFTAPTLRGRLARAIEERDDGLLVRDGHVRAEVVRAAQRVHAPFEHVRRRVPRLVRRVDAGGLERRLEHRRADGVAERMCR